MQWHRGAIGAPLYWHEFRFFPASAVGGDQSAALRRLQDMSFDPLDTFVEVFNKIAAEAAKETVTSGLKVAGLSETS